VRYDWNSALEAMVVSSVLGGLHWFGIDRYREITLS
jgi:hypothetical protein